MGCRRPTRALDRRQLAALVRTAAVELSTVLPAVRQEVAWWGGVAQRCAVEPFAHVALANLRRERLNLEGAALFSVLHDGRDRRLVRLLVAYQAMLDYLDSVGEQLAASAGGQVRTTDALEAALNPSAPFVATIDDGGYLDALGAACRSMCRTLPRFGLVAERVCAHARTLSVQDINHDPDPVARRANLLAWIDTRFEGRGRPWPWELGAAASSTVAICALLSVAADPDLRHDEVARLDAAYFPGINALGTLLDSWVDARTDRMADGCNYVDFYGSTAAAGERIGELARESMCRARELPRGERHALIVSGMIAMYLSHAEARSPELRAASREISRAAGPLQHVQLPIMRVLRAVHGLHSA